MKESDPIGHLARVEKAGKKAKSSNVKDSEKSRVQDGELRVPLQTGAVRPLP